MRSEINSRQQLENDQYTFYRNAIEKGYAAIVGRKSS